MQDTSDEQTTGNSAYVPWTSIDWEAPTRDIVDLTGSTLAMGLSLGESTYDVKRIPEPSKESCGDEIVQNCFVRSNRLFWSGVHTEHVIIEREKYNTPLIQ
jgi:hypothetical protein